MTVPMFKGLFGSKEKKAQEGYVPPSVPNFETAGVADGARAVGPSASDSSSSAFSFISSAPVPETAAAPSSAFGFIASDPSVTPVQLSTAPYSSPPAPAPASGFSFIQDAPAAPSSSGFSFIQEASVAASDAAEVDPKILEENMRVAGLKKVVKKRSMARKPGQAVHDDDDPPATSSQKQSTPAVTDSSKSSASVDLLNQTIPPAVSSVTSLPSLAEHEKSDQPAFSFMSTSAVADKAAQPSTLPSDTATTSANVANPILSFQQDSDGDNSDGGGLDLDGMIIHEVAPEVRPPPVHQPQQQHHASSSSLRDWMEMRDDSSGKMCVCCSFFLMVWTVSCFYSYYQNNATQVTSWDPPPGWSSQQNASVSLSNQNAPSSKQTAPVQEFSPPISSSDFVHDAQRGAEAFETFASKVLLDNAAASDCSCFVSVSDSIRNAATNSLLFLDNVISKCNLSVAELLDKQADLTTNVIKKLEKELIAISSDIQIATQAEDFERAEALTSDEHRATRSLSQRKAELDLVNAELSTAQSKIGRILSLKVQVSESLIRFTTSCASAASAKGSATVNELVSQLEITNAKMNSKARQASALHESLDLEKKRLADDEKILADKIYDMTRDDQEQVSRLQSVQNVVIQEIAELERQLRAKLSEKAQLERDIQELNSGFEVVKQDFAPQYSALHARRESHLVCFQQLDAIRAEVHSKEVEVAQQTAACDAAKATLASVSSRLSNIVSGAAVLLAAQRSFVESYTEEQLEKAKEAEQEDTERKEMQSIELRIQQSSSSLEKVSSSLLSLQAEVQGIISEVLRIDIRLPELESQKKAAVTAKKFKEAGLFSSESKDLLTRKEELLSRKEQLGAEEGAKKQEVVRLEASQASLCIEKEKLSKVHDSQRLPRLIRRHKLRAGAQSRAIASDDFASAESLQKECSNIADEIKIISVRLGIPMIDLQEHLLVRSVPASQSSHEYSDAKASIIPFKEQSGSHQQIEVVHANISPEQNLVQLNLDENVGLSTSDASAKLQTLKELASKLDDQLDRLVSEEKFEEADEYNRQLDEVRRQINTLEDRLQSHGLNLSESDAQPSSASLDLNHQPSMVFEMNSSTVVDAADAAAKLQTLKELASKLDDQLDRLVSEEKFEEADEYNRQLDEVRRQINSLEVEMQSHSLNLSESGSQTSAAVQWEQDHQSEKSGASGFGRTFFSDSVPGDGRTIRSFCSGASTGSNDEDDRGSKDGAGTVYTIGSLYSQAHAEGGGEDTGELTCCIIAFNSRSALN